MSEYIENFKEAIYSNWPATLAVVAIGAWTYFASRDSTSHDKYEGYIDEADYIAHHYDADYEEGKL